jgi:xanthine dehydrogenase accessory factor
MGVVGDAVRDWLGRGDQAVALATVVRVYQSAPRQAGATLAVSERGELEGSVSGGCIEGDIALEAAEVLAAGVPRLVQTGITDAVAWDAGLTCGGAIDVWVERLDAPVARWYSNGVARPSACVSVTLLDGVIGLPAGTRAIVHRDHIDIAPGGPGELPEPVIRAARELLDEGHRGGAGIHEVVLTVGSTVRVFLDPWPGAPELVVFGAVHVTQVLVQLAHAVGFDTVVVDPRTTFATEDRVGHADRLIRRWPQDVIADGEVVLGDASFVVVLTHDPKLDEPALAAALRSPAPYIGCLGSRKTQGLRRDRLRREGFSDQDLARIRGPIGLDIGSRTPEELALAIMAEVVAVARGGRIVAQRGDSTKPD